MNLSSGTTTRRDFLKLGLVSGAALVLQVLPDGAIALMEPDGPTGGIRPFQPNPWLAVDASDQVTVWVARAEMGQGVRTALPMIVADELDVDWQKVSVMNASPGPDFTQMRTSGSGSVMGGWESLRRAGALARLMLIQAAAAAWVVPPVECRTENGVVIHDASGRRFRYGELVDAADAMSVPDNVSLKRSPTLAGTAVPRIDGPLIVDGSARYGSDLKVPGMLYASVERPPRFGARIEKVDNIPAAMAVPEVVEVRNIAGGVVVLAETTWAAMKGREALKVSWTGGEPPFDSRAHLSKLVEATQTDGLVARTEGDVARAVGGASRKIEAVYEYGFQAHAPLEPMNCIAQVKPDGCEIWTGTQAANQVQGAVAEKLGLDPSKVIVNVALMGGGFGRRLGLDFVLEAVEISRLVGSPVQVVWTRADDMKHGFFQPASAHRMTAGLDSSGRPIAWKHVMAGSPLTAIRKPDLEDPDLAKDLMWGGYDNPYAFPAMHNSHVLVLTPVPTGPWRAVHYPPGLLARECFIDEIAHAGGVDPLRARIELLGGDGATGNAGRLVRVLKAVAAKSGWGGKLPAGRGRGLAANIYHGATTMAQVAEVSVEGPVVRVHRIVCAVDCGFVVNPLGLEAQIESAIIWGLSATLFGEITFSDGAADQSNFADYPVVRMPQAPNIEIEVLKSDLPPLGIGEQPVAPVTPAVLNAIFAATGKRIRRSPVRPADLL